MQNADSVLSQLPIADRAHVDVVLLEFDRSWTQDRLSAEVARLPANGLLRTVTLVELVKIDLERKWQQGQKLHLESYLARLPELGTVETIRLELIRSELDVRRQFDSPVSVEELARRFPSHSHDELRQLVEVFFAQRTPSEASQHDSDSQTDTTHPGQSSSKIPAERPQQFGRDGSGRRLGDYELRGELGRGGMGVVYRAWQTSASREVALKVILAGSFASSVDEQRFAREARTAARLDHPSIVPVYDVGTHAGQQFFTMKLVDGGALSQRLREFQERTQEAARIVLVIAQAVHYAHQHGILHRDLKPANILLDRGLHPWVTDFGLAKCVESDTILTESDAMLGTPSYMAPELADGNARGATTAADVYSIGAILFALLTGRPPFESESVARTLQMVLTAEAPRPRSLNRRIPVDLEVVCLKCLQKRPTDRYESAKALADDIAAVLEGRPIHARPIGPVARLGRWCRRNPLITGLAGLAILFATIGGCTTTVQWLRAENHLAAAQLQRDRAENSYRLARQALYDCVRQITQDPRLKSGPLEDLRLQVFDAQLDFHRAFVDLYGNDPERTADLAESHLQLGRAAYDLEDYDAARSQIQQALQLFDSTSGSPPSTQFHRQIALCWQYLGLIRRNSGQYQAAESAYREAIRIHEASPIETLAPDDAIELASDYNHLGDVLHECDRDHPAEEAYKQALQICDRLVQSHPDAIPVQVARTTCYNNLGYLYSVTDRVPDAEQVYLKALPIYEGLTSSQPDNSSFHDTLAYIHSNIAELYAERLERPNDAEAEFKKAINIRTELARRHPLILDYQAELAACHDYLGDRFRRQGRAADAEREIMKALEVCTSWSPLQAKRPRTRTILAYTRFQLGQCLAGSGAIDQAESHLQLALSLYEELAREFPEHVAHLEHIVDTCVALEAVYMTSGHLADAEKALRKIVASRKAMCDQSPENQEYFAALTESCQTLAEFLKSAGRQSDSEPVYQDLLAWLLAEPHFLHGSGRHEFTVDILQKLGEIYVQTQQLKEANDAYRLALETIEVIDREDPTNHDGAKLLSESLVKMAESLASIAQFDNAERCFLRSLMLLKRIQATTSYSAEISDGIAYSQTLLAQLYRRKARLGDAEQAYRQAISEREKVAERFPRDYDNRGVLSWLYTCLAEVLHESQQIDRSVHAYRRSVDAGCALVRDDPADATRLVAVIQSYSKFAEMLVSAGRREDAKAISMELADFYEQQRKSRRNNPLHPIDTADLQVNVANVNKLCGQFDEALQWYGMALMSLTDSCSQSESMNNDCRVRLIGAYAGRGQVLLDLRRNEEAFQDWDKAIALDREDRIWMRASRALAQARLGRREEALAELEEIVDAPQFEPGDFLYFGRIYALCAKSVANVSATEEDLALKAMKCLQHAAVPSASRLWEKMQPFLGTDTDLESLRYRQDYIEFVKRLREDASAEQ